MKGQFRVWFSQRELEDFDRATAPNAFKDWYQRHADDLEKLLRKVAAEDAGESTSHS